jgi:hypothetical protein
MEHFDSTKIVDADLRSFAASEGRDERRSIIVELGVPPPPLALTFERRLGTFPKPLPQRGKQMDTIDLSDVEGHSASMDELERQLCSLGLAADSVRLDAAQAFVVPVTAEQLRAVSRMPLAGIIRPNRSHYAPPHA